VSDDKGKIIGWMIVLRDVTKEHQISQAREIITDTLVHDLRSPLSAVLSSLDIIEKGLSKLAPQDELSNAAVQVARRGSRRILGMVETLLDIARMQSGKFELAWTWFSIHSLIASVLDEYLIPAQKAGVRVNNDVPVSFPQVWGDMDKLNRVLANLLDNALKFIPFGGQVDFSAEIVSEEIILVQVSDNGPGIPEEYREKVFERFAQVPGYRGRRRGSGLGLTFCRLAVQAHGGRIWIEPRPGGGSVFNIILPIPASQFPGVKN
jgi:two-component system, NtrC family, sensor histidine kinase KinB